MPARRRGRVQTQGSCSIRRTSAAAAAAEFEAQYDQQAEVALFNEFGLRSSRYDSAGDLNDR